MTARVQQEPLPAEDPNGEQFVLSAALHGPEGVQAALRVANDDFRPGANQHVHRAIITLSLRGLHVNAETVRDELERGGHLTAGPYVARLLGYNIPGPMAETYADRVIQAANDRRILEASQRLVQLSGADSSEARTDAIQLQLEGIRAALDGQRATGGRTLHMIPAAGRRIRAARWLMHLRIPLGAITLLTGREGIGKSTTSYSIIADLTNGVLPGQYYGTPKSVAIVATEDAWEEVILPRLFAAGADMARIHQTEAKTSDGYLSVLSVPGDLDRLTTSCVTHDIGLIVLDPLMSVMPSGIDTHKDRDVRTALDPLAQFCATTGVAVLGLIHVNKSNGHDPLNSIMASKAFTAVARSVLYCIVDPEAEREDRYLFGHVKSNLGPKQPSMAYRITQVEIEVPSDQPGVLDVVTTSRVAWEGEDTRSIASLMEPRRPPKPNGELVDRILEFIADQPGVVSAAMVIEEMPEVKPNTIRQTLRRMVDRQQLVTPLRGSYRLPPDESDSRSDTSLETN